MVLYANWISNMFFWENIYKFIVENYENLYTSEFQNKSGDI